jgi:hypothetical protein
VEKEKEALSGVGKEDSGSNSGDLVVDNDEGFSIIESAADDDDMVIESLPAPSKKREREEDEDANSGTKR